MPMTRRELIAKIAQGDPKSFVYIDLGPEKELLPLELADIYEEVGSQDTHMNLLIVLEGKVGK